MSERGVKETKEVLAFVFSMATAIKTSLSDGDFDFWDAKNFDWGETEKKALYPSWWGKHGV